MANQKPVVAIITRTKDRPEAFLERALESVHNQTYDDFVHVIINDGGDPQLVDATILRLPNKIQERIKVVHNTHSSGMEAASNKAIEAVDSEFIAIHDDDDSWHTEFLERSLKKVTQNNAAGVVVRTNKVVEAFDENSGLITTEKTETWMSDVKAINLYRQCIDNQMTPITFLYRRNAYYDVGKYDESLPVTGDWDFGIRFLQKYDVEYLDPGFALANYHHRKYVSGSSANNSFGDGVEKHRYYSNRLMNKYLREELSQGRFGVGYIMSKERYAQSYISKVAMRVLPTAIAKRLKSRVQY